MLVDTAPWILRPIRSNDNAAASARIPDVTTEQVFSDDGFPEQPNVERATGHHGCDSWSSRAL